MFRKVLIANRGEIAVRIIRACKELGVKTVAVYSEADRDALHVKLADEAVCIGKDKSQGSYLNMENIISATILTGAQAIHPGFGFLSENSKFARLCKDCNIKFIGPDADVIDLMGNKSKARETMIKAGVPVVPGSEGDVTDAKEGLEIAEKIGFPVMIKAAAGGGGKGMREVFDKKDFEKLFDTAKSESKVCFGDDRMYIEKLIEEPRHIEFQIMADSYRNVIHLGERDCSIQRRHHKVLEESPSPAISEKLRKKMGQAAVDAAKAVKYENAGTIEFLLDKNGDFYFMEMNTRIQVEHPVTEMVTGFDLVKEQIRVAAMEKLSKTQDEICVKGHAIECRINAENPELNFRPSPGTVSQFIVPGGMGVRVDSGIYAGYKIPPIYDSMIAKLIVYGNDRSEALAKMRRALDEFYIEGVDNNISFQRKIMDNEKYISGKFDTSFISAEYNL